MRRDLEMPRRGRKRSGGPVRQLAIPLSSRLECHGCGTRVPVDEVRPYRCRQGEARDGVDHVLRRVFDATTFKSWNDPGQIFSDLEPNPFRKFRRLFYSYEIARLGGITDSGYVATVNRIDRAVADVDGRGFVATPCKRQPDLARAAGLGPEALWVKDETGNVAGSHKGRHLMGILLWLEIVRALRRPEGTSPLLAIASCGNAALAAGVLARAAARPLEVFVPPGAKKSVTTRLAALGARVTTCPRREQDPPGDPCYHRFVEAWEAGALPFTVQAKRNGLAVEGGSTLVWEMVSVWMGQGHVPDHLVIQVGGGALAAACFEGLKEARALGMIDRLPRLHTVQTAACAPLARAYRRLAERFPGAAAGAALRRDSPHRVHAAVGGLAP